MPRKKEKPEASKGTRMRVVTLLDCTPGNAKTPDGPPIGIMTLAHLDEIEQPMMLTIEDMHLLLTKTLEVLATHKDPFARYIIDTYMTADSTSRKDDGDDSPDDAGEAWKNA